MNSATFHEFESRAVNGKALAENVASALSDAVSLRGQAYIVVSGGSTPAPFFAALQDHALDWDKIHFIVADERWVPCDHEDSNEKLLRSYLGDRGHILSLCPKDTDETVADGAARLEQTPNILGDVCFDCVILGMGEDGHTASLFPHHPMLSEALDPACSNAVLPITDSPKPPSERVTLTAQRLINCRHLFLHIHSADKKAVYEQAMKTKDVSAAPIYHFIQQQTVPLHVYWAV